MDRADFLQWYRREKQCAREMSAPTRPDELKQWTERLQKGRGRPGYYPYMESGRGNGPFVELVDGSVKLDFITGIGVHFFGHANPELKWECIQALCDEATLVQGNLQYSQNYVRLCENLLLAANSQGATRLAHVWLAPTGAMCNENALKMVRQKRAPAFKVLTFHHGFYGRTQTLAEITDNPGYREGLPLFSQVDYIPFFDPKDPEGSTQRTLKALDGFLKKSDDYAVFVTELIQGEGGFNAGTTDFFRRVFERVRKSGIPIWIDEVQTFGRTGEFFAFQRFALEEFVDVVTVGKMLHACATIYTKDLNPRSGLVSGTFAASSTSLAVGNWTLKKLHEGGYLGPSGSLRQLEMVALDELMRLSQNQCRGRISEPVAFGGMVAFQVFDGSDAVTKKFLNKLYENGVIAFTCGHQPVRVRFLLPAGVLSKEELLLGLKVVARTINEVV